MTDKKDNAVERVTVSIEPATAQTLIEWGVLHLGEEGPTIDLDIWRTRPTQPIADDVRDIVATAILNASRNHNGLTNLGNISAVLSRAQAYNAADAALEALGQSAPSSGGSEVEQELVAMLTRDHARMRKAGCVLAEAALHVIREYDGLHRLSLAVAEWSKAVADEGDRATPLSQPSTPAGEDMLTDLRMSLEALVAGEASVDETECDILNLPELREALEFRRALNTPGAIKIASAPPIYSGNKD